MGARLTMGCSAQLSADLTQEANLEKAAKRVARRPASAHMPNRELMDAPTRRSSRIEGRPAMNYSENELSAVRAARAPLAPARPAQCAPRLCMPAHNVARQSPA